MEVIAISMLNPGDKLIMNGRYEAVHPKADRTEALQWAGPGLMISMGSMNFLTTFSRVSSTKMSTLLRRGSESMLAGNRIWGGIIDQGLGFKS